MGSVASCNSNQRGFTLIELLVSMSLTSVLAVMSMQTFYVLKQKTNSTTTERTRQNLELALEAGTNSLELDPSGFYMAWVTGDGSLNGIGQNDFLPGLKVNDNIFLFARYDALCENGLGGFCNTSFPCCIVDTYSVMNCKGGIAKSRMCWNDGTVFDWEWDNAAWC
jgi:prepilin-type N-terminal cleavage/methylation domain-containing protein